MLFRVRRIVALRTPTASAIRLDRRAVGIGRGSKPPSFSFSSSSSPSSPSSSSSSSTPNPERPASSASSSSSPPSSVLQPLNSFLYGRPKTEEEKAIEAKEEAERLERIRKLPPPEHKELIDRVIADVREDVLDIYEHYHKRRRLGRFGRLRKKHIPRLVADLRLLGVGNTVKIVAGGGLALTACRGIFDALGTVDRLYGWAFYLTLICGYRWKEDTIWSKWSDIYMKMKYPQGLSATNLQYELRIPDDRVAEQLFHVIRDENHTGDLIPSHVVSQWKHPPLACKRALEMLLQTWDFDLDKERSLKKVSITPVALSMIEAGLIKSQEGAYHVEKLLKDFPPNWKEPHKEEVLAWPLVFDKSIQKEKVRTADQLVEEILVLHGMQFEGDNIDGELTDLHFDGTIRYLAARSGFSDVDEFRKTYLRWASHKIAEHEKEKEEEREKQKVPWYVALNPYWVMSGRLATPKDRI